MLARVFLLSLLLTFGAAGHVSAETPSTPPATSPPTPTVPSTAPVSTFNEFIPQDRPLGDCISAAPRPGCGSEARGGWRQGLVMIALVLGLSVIGWRIIVGVRRSPQIRS